MSQVDIARPARPQIADIQRAVARHFMMSINELCSHRRWPEIVLARQTAMYLCRKLTRKSLTVIGERFGDYDHSTVWHATKKLEARMLHDVVLAGEVHGLMLTISSKSFAFRHGEVRPALDAFDTALNGIGFELAIVPIGMRDKHGFVGVSAADQKRVLNKEVLT